MIFGLDRSQKILKALLGFYTVFDCLWSCISYFFPAFWPNITGLREWIASSDVQLLGTVFLFEENIENEELNAIK